MQLQSSLVEEITPSPTGSDTVIGVRHFGFTLLIRLSLWAQVSSSMSHTFCTLFDCILNCILFILVHTQHFLQSKYCCMQRAYSHPTLSYQCGLNFKTLVYTSVAVWRVKSEIKRKALWNGELRRGLLVRIATRACTLRNCALMQLDILVFL